MSPWPDLKECLIRFVVKPTVCLDPTSNELEKIANCIPNFSKSIIVANSQFSDSYTKKLKQTPPSFTIKKLVEI